MGVKVSVRVSAYVCESEDVRVCFTVRVFECGMAGRSEGQGCTDETERE